MILVGVDENGLGPRLGPLVVTSIEARAIDESAVRVANSRPRGKLRERLGDSKDLVSYADSSLGEAWARALLPELSGAHRPTFWVRSSPIPPKASAHFVPRTTSGSAGMGPPKPSGRKKRSSKRSGTISTGSPRRVFGSSARASR